MASSITAAPLTIKITEDITLNGQQQGTTNTITTANIAEFSRRIVTVPTSEVILVSFGDANSFGTFHDTDVQYVRITNLDDTNYVSLNFEGDASTDFTVRLDKNRGTYLAVLNHASLGMDDYADISAATLEAINTIKAIANTGACNLEVVVACK